MTRPDRPCATKVRHVACLALLALPVTALAAGTPINRRTAADPAGTVEVSNVAGTVTVTGWDRNEVEVTGELGKGSESLEFTRNEKQKVVRVKVILPKRSHDVDGSTLHLKVPVGSTVVANVVSADLTVKSVRGPQRLQTVSGDVRAESSGEDLECRTVSGDVFVTGSGRKGLVSITTVSGDVEAKQVAGEVNGNTVSGSVTLQAGEVARSRLRSTSGDLRLAAKLLPEARLDAETISGDVRFDLLGTTPVQLDLDTFNGDIDNCFGPDAERTSEYAPGRELRFDEPGATARVRIKTLNGDIGICRR